MEQVKIITSTRNHAATPISSDRADESDTDEENSSDDENTFNVVEELRLQIRWLTQLGPVLEQNLVSAQKARIQATLPAHVPFCVSGPAEIYVSLVREKYKQAQDQLIERLGEANWQRHISVRKSMEASANVAEETTAPVGDSAVAQSVFRPYSAFHDSGIGPSIPAQTEYAASHTSFQSSNTGGERESVRVPATPVEVNDGKPFQCFLCKRILSDIKNRVDWKYVSSDYSVLDALDDPNVNVILECTFSPIYNPTYVPSPTAQTSWRNSPIEQHGRSTSSHNIASLSRGVVLNALRLLSAFPNGKAIFKRGIAFSSLATLSSLQKTWHTGLRRHGLRTTSVPSVALLLANLAEHLSSTWGDIWRKSL